MPSRDLAMAWVKAFNRADPDGLTLLYADNAIIHQVPEQPIAGREAIRALYAQIFAGPEIIYMVENLFDDGEWAILEWRDPLGLRGCVLFHVVASQINFQRGYFDRLSFARQHGLPVPRDMV